MNGPSQISGCFPPNFISIVKVEFETSQNANSTGSASAPPAGRKKRSKRILTEEQRKRQAEYKREWKTKLTDEQRKKNAEYQREYRAKLTEERRLKEVERDRVRRANLTDEQRRRRTECDRKRRASLTEEQRKMRAEYKRKWRARQPEEKRRRIAELRRNRRANLSEEQRIRERERDRDRHANLTIEQRKWKTICTREWYGNLSEEQRKIHLRRRQIRAQYNRANLTEEQRKKRSEYIRKSNANITTEQRIRRSEWYRKWYAKLTVEQRKVRVERRRQRINSLPQNTVSNPQSYKINGDIIQQNVKCLMKAKIPQQIIQSIKIEYDDQNPLHYLLNQVSEGRLINALINGFDKHFFRKILQIFTTDYPHDILCPDKYSKEIIYYEIDIHCLIELLKRWDGWTVYKKINHDQAYEDIYYYLRHNLNNIKKTRNQILIRELNLSFGKLHENVINVSCSLQRLKTLFYHEPHKYVKYYRRDVFIPATPHHLMSSFPQYIYNWPFISTKIDLPNFSMSHQISNTNEFCLIDITKNFRKNTCKPQNNNLYCDMSNVSEKISSTIIIKFFDHLKTAIVRSDDNEISLHRKSEIINAIKEFSTDVALCSNAIETNTKYYVNLNPYPYTRYLGFPDDGIFDISISEQKLISNSQINIRLQQICHPKILFTLEKFNIIYEMKNDDLYFTFDNSFLDKINNCIFYKCMLCNEDLGTHSPSQIISEHLLNFHGFEPDWECINCKCSFTTNDLSKCRWGHNCNHHQ